MLRKLLYFGSNKKSILHLSPPEYTPSDKNDSPYMKPWVYIRNFKVYLNPKKNWPKSIKIFEFE